jgi:hypothetical protein
MKHVNLKNFLPQKVLSKPHCGSVQKPAGIEIKKTHSPADMLSYFEIYFRGRKSGFPNFNALMQVFAVIFDPWKRVKIIKSAEGKILGGYSYMRWSERPGCNSVIIDSIAKDKSAQELKEALAKCLKDIIETDKKGKAERIGLWVDVKDKKLKTLYEQYGFKVDNARDMQIEKFWYMSVKVKNLKAYFGKSVPQHGGLPRQPHF